jgi:hypothetical protein
MSRSYSRGSPFNMLEVVEPARCSVEALVAGSRTIDRRRATPVAALMSPTWRVADG